MQFTKSSFTGNTRSGTQLDSHHSLCLTKYPNKDPVKSFILHLFVIAPWPQTCINPNKSRLSGSSRGAGTIWGGFKWLPGLMQHLKNKMGTAQASHLAIIFFASMGQPKDTLDLSLALERFKQVKAQNTLYEKQQMVGRWDDTAEVSHLQDL